MDEKRPLCMELYAKMQSQLLRPRVIVDYTHRAKDQVNFHTADTIDGIDFFAFGHDHNPKDKPRGKLAYDCKAKSVRQKTVEVINCGSFLDYGGYAVDGGYRVPAQKMYMLRLLDQGRGMETTGFYL